MKVLVCSDFDSVMNKGHNNPEFQFFPPENVEKIESKFEVVWNKTGRKLTKEELIEKVADCDAVITCWGSNMFDEEVIANAPKLKLLAHFAGSVAPYVSEALYDKGIKVIGANDMMFAESVAEGAIAYMLCSQRKIKQIQKHMENRAEGWVESKKDPFKRGILYKTVGIVSFGAIGEHLARLLQPFGCKIKVYSRNISEEKLQKYNMQRASLEEIFSTCDIISLHTAWNKHTEKMINRDLLKLIKDDALLVNTARGQIIDEEALADELETGRFSAALDVFWQEPLPSESRLYGLDNVLIMPHNGGPTPDLYKHIASSLIDEMYDYLENGAPLRSEIPKSKGLSMTLA